MDRMTPTEKLAKVRENIELALADYGDGESPIAILNEALSVLSDLEAEQGWRPKNEK